MKIHKRKDFQIGIGILIIIAIILIVVFMPRNNVVPNTSGHMHNMMINSEEEFIFEMVPHHQEAVDTAKEILAKTENPELKKLAQNIVNTQTEEISMMEGWKRQWYSDSKYRPSYIRMMPPLGAFSGGDADTAFMQGMIMHHQMAINMAQQVLKLNPRKEVSDFANNIIRVQSAEIAQMQKMLSNR